MKGALANTILQGKVEGKSVKDHEEGQRRQWSDDVKQWTGLSLNEMPEDCVAWRKRAK